MKFLRQIFLKPYLYIIIILTGVALKFYHIDYKLFWFDEVCTIQHTSGISDGEFPEKIAFNEVLNINDYRKLYRLKEQGYSAGDQLIGLFSSTQLTPLHYSFLIFWYRLVGDDPVHYRFFSVFIFLLTLPIFYWLGIALFKSRLAGWIGTSLYAVSPYVHLFAQEARYYILWSFFLILINYLFLKATQNNKRKCWVYYTVFAILAMYASPFSILILFAHLVYVLLLEKKDLKTYGVVLLIVFVGYVPWMYSLYRNFQEISRVMSWQTQRYDMSLPILLIGQLSYFISVFTFTLDYFTVFDPLGGSPPQGILSAFVFNTFILTMLIISLVNLIRRADNKIKYIILLNVFPGCIFFLILDLTRQGITSWWWRYFIFSAAGLILIVTYLLYTKIEKGKMHFALFYLFFAALGIGSILTIASKRHWFLGNNQNIHIEDARFISTREFPLIITDFGYNVGMVDFVVTLGEVSHENVDIVRVNPSELLLDNFIVNKDYSQIYLMYASEELVQAINKKGIKTDSLQLEHNSPIWQISIESKVNQ